MRTILVSKTMAGKRLDAVVLAELNSLSRSSVQKLSKFGRISVNNSPSKPGQKVHDGDKINIDYNETNNDTIPKIEIPVIYEDDDCVVINKPVGLLSHSKGSFNPEATVATWLQPKFNGLSNDRAGIVHRLDRATSGVMICAKNEKSLKWLQKQFSTRKVKKVYQAIVDGQLNDLEAIIDMPIERNPKAHATFRVGVNGRSAQTHYKVIQTVSKFSLIELSPATGRTHQLRVHLSKLNHPIVGDALYGGSNAPRMFLHALSLEITLPNKSHQKFNITLPKSFIELIKRHDN